jgi:hypothetical protein
MAMWLGFLAAPTFAAMAALTLMVGGNAMRVMCGVDAPPIARMDAMYLLMSIFHLAPWLKLIANRTSYKKGRPTP